MLGRPPGYESKDDDPLKELLNRLQAVKKNMAARTITNTLRRLLRPMVLELRRVAPVNKNTHRLSRTARVERNTLTLKKSLTSVALKVRRSQPYSGGMLVGPLKRKNYGRYKVVAFFRSGRGGAPLKGRRGERKAKGSYPVNTFMEDVAKRHEKRIANDFFDEIYEQIILSMAREQKRLGKKLGEE